MRVSVVPAQWPGDTIPDIRRVTRLARDLGATGVWFSEVNGYDAFALAGGLVAAGDTGGTEVIMGPIPIAVRDPAMMAMGLATVQASASARVSVALGASSPAVVEKWHGRTFAHPAHLMSSYVPALRSISNGAKHDATHGTEDSGVRLMVPGVSPLRVSVAALGPRMMRVAADVADQVVLNLTGPETVGEMKSIVNAANRSSDRQVDVAVWLMTGSPEASLERASRLLSAYLDAPGYRERLVASGLDRVLRTSPKEAAATIGAFGPDSLSHRLHEYREQGADEVALVVSGADPSAAELLKGAIHG
jgi:probable F420-dependent oxidoreductase